MPLPLDGNKDSKTTDHAAEKPVDLMRHLIRLTTKPGGLVWTALWAAAPLARPRTWKGAASSAWARDRTFHGIAVPLPVRAAAFTAATAR